MLSIFAFTLLINAVLALPSLHHPEPSFPASDHIDGMINTTGGEIKARQTVVDETSLSVPIKCDILGCTARIGIGTPPVHYTVLVDTGLSNTWIGINTSFVPTSSTVSTGQNVSVVYGSGNFSGFEVLDTVTLGPGLVIQGQSIGIATQSSGFPDHFDGFLGLGPTDLTVGKLSPNSSAAIPTVLDNLKNQGIIDSRVFGISSQPLGQCDSTPGEIIFGTTEPSDLTSRLELFPITTSTSGNANTFWAFDMSMTYGNTTSLISNQPAVVDYGASYLGLNEDAFAAYQRETGGTVLDDSGLLTISSDQFENLQPLVFTILQNITYTLSPNAQRAAHTPGSDPARVTLFVTSLGRDAPGAVLGASFMHYFYSAFDAGNSLVGIATTNFTNAIVN